MRTPRPNIKQRTVASTVIAHRELVQSLTGTTTFTVSSALAINPGNSQLFPWLATQAIGWEQFRFKRLSFQYVSRCATSTPGSVMLAVDYDSVDGATLPATESALSANQTFEDGPCWVTMMVINCDPKALMEPGPRKFIRLTANGGVPNRLADCGLLYIATNDFASAVACGKVYVDYEIEMFIPQIAIAPGGNTTELNYASGGGITPTNLFGNAPVSNGVLGTTPSVNTITFAVPGAYVVSVVMTGTSITALSLSGSSTASATNNLVSGVGAVFNTADTQLAWVFTVVTNAANQNVIFTCTASTVTSFTAFIAATTTAIA
jgi:hypothetical protein